MLLELSDVIFSADLSSFWAKSKSQEGFLNLKNVIIVYIMHVNVKFNNDLDKKCYHNL